MKNDKEKLKKKLSVALAVYNEEENLSKCLESVKDLADEIVVVDGGSNDKTIEIAKQYGAKIIKADNPIIFHINKQKAVAACTKDWILQLDADEIVSRDLKKEIQEILKTNLAFAGFYISRENSLLGRKMKKGGMWPDYVIRLFKNGKGKFPCQTVHEQIAIEGEVGYLKNPLIHNAYPDFSEYLKKANTYTSLTAFKMKEEKMTPGFGLFIKYFFLKPIQTFSTLYIRHQGFLDGFPGFAWALFSALHFPISYIKFWEEIHRMKNEK